MTPDPIRWTRAEPRRAERERTEMARIAPDLRWTQGLSRRGRSDLCGWEGCAPVWAGERPKPKGVDELLGDERLRLRVIYAEAFPMVAPALVPVDPEVPLERRTRHAWHVNGDGSLCMLQTANAWDPDATAADLVAKASGWFIEYKLMLAGRIEQMTLHGLLASDELDDLLGEDA